MSVFCLQQPSLNRKAHLGTVSVAFYLDCAQIISYASYIENPTTIQK